MSEPTTTQSPSLVHVSPSGIPFNPAGSDPWLQLWPPSEVVSDMTSLLPAATRLGMAIAVQRVAEVQARPPTKSPDVSSAGPDREDQVRPPSVVWKKTEPPPAPMPRRAQVVAVGQERRLLEIAAGKVTGVQVCPASVVVSIESSGGEFATDEDGGPLEATPSA